MNQPHAGFLEVLRARPWRLTIAAALYLTLLTGPLAAQAGSVAQSPLFVSPPVPADVVFLLDDSGSMNTYALPTPADINLSGVAVLVPIANGIQFPAAAWELQSATINPLWYNPAITYTPWNNDNNVNNFANADFGGSAQVADPVHLTQQDMRYVALGSRYRVNAGTGTIGPDQDLYVPLQTAIVKALGLSSSASAYYPGMALGSEPEGYDLFSRIPAGTASACSVTIPCNPANIVTPGSYYDPATETIITPPPFCSAVPVCPPQDLSTVISPGYNAAASYFVWDGVAGTKSNSAHYTLIEIARYKGSAAPSLTASANAAGNVYTPRDTNGQVVQRSDCVTNAATTGTCTFSEEAQNFANWFTYYRSRLFAAIAVSSQAMSTFTDSAHSSLRVGYGQINYFNGQPSPWDPGTSASNYILPSALDGATSLGALVRGIRPFTVGSTARQQVFDWLFGLSAYGATPSREALDAIGRYYSRTDSAGPWGSTPGTATATPASSASANTVNGCRRAYTILTTDGEWTSGPTSQQPVLGVTSGYSGAAVPGLDSAGATPLNAATSSNGTIIRGSGADASLTFLYKPGLFADITAASVTANSANGSSNPVGNTAQTLTDVAMYYWNRDLQPNVPNALQIGDGTADPAFWQHMSTFAVAYGLSAPEDTTANRAIVAANNAAIAGGSTTKTGINWPAVDTSTTLQVGGNRIDDVFRATMASGGDFYSAANPQQLANDIGSAFGQFATVSASGTSVGAPGVNLFAGNDVFTASFKTQVWTGSLNAYEAAAFVAALTANETPTPLWNATIPASRNLYTSVAASGGALAFSATVPQVAQKFSSGDMVTYLAGDRSLEGTKYRVRTGLLGDIVDSSPYYSGVVDYGFGAQPASNGGGTIYSSYLSNMASRAGLVYVGANDGIWHAFAASNGQELFGYIPRAVLPTSPAANDQIATLTSLAYQHQFFVDGATTEGDAYFAGAWHRIAVGSDGAGSSSLFAIDTTALGNASAANVKWEITPSEDATLGHILGAGAIGSSTNAVSGGSSSYIYLNGNGFDSPAGSATLLIRDVATGALLRSITVDGGPGDGLGPVSVVYDGQRNITTAYAGDLKGRLWKFDLSPNSASAWTVANNGKPLFQATAGVPYQPITVAPRLAANPAGGYSVSFGTGQLFEIGDNTNVSPQSIYSIIDNNGGGTTITPSSLSALSITKNSDGSLAIKAPATSSSLGFYLNLTALSGERVIRSATINGAQVDFTSYAPSDPNGTLCGPSASSFYYQLNLSTGSGVASSVSGTVGGVALLQLQPANSTLAAASGALSSGTVSVGVKPSSWNKATTTTAARQCVGGVPGVSGSLSGATPQCTTAPVLRVWRQPLKAPS